LNKTVNYELTKPEENEYYDVEVPNGNMDIIDTKMKEVEDKANAAAAKSTLATAPLPASGWTGTESPYSITVTVAGAKPEPTRIEVQPTTDATAAQWAAWRAALIRGGGQGTDSLTLLADGDKPEIDIPIAVTIRGDVS